MVDVIAEVRVSVEREADIVTARQKGRELAASRGFGSSDQTLVALAISEVARNIVVYANRGEILIAYADEAGRRGILIVARDEGPGIDDPELAMQDGYSTTNSLGLGLPGAKRIMDEFELVTERGAGTTITMKKWLR